MTKMIELDVSGLAQVTAQGLEDALDDLVYLGMRYEREGGPALKAPEVLAALVEWARDEHAAGRLDIRQSPKGIWAPSRSLREGAQR